MIKPETPKQAVLRRFPKARCTEQTLWNGTSYTVWREYDNATGPVSGDFMAVAGSAKAAWHYAYAKMVTEKVR